VRRWSREGCYLWESQFTVAIHRTRVDAYAQPDPRAEVSFPSPSSNCPSHAGARARMRLIGELCLFTPQSALRPLQQPISRQYLMGDLRRSISIEQYMAFFKFLRIRAMLEVLLKGILAYMAGWSDGGDGRLVDYGLA
jgi:hypothetical protein